MDNTKVLPCNCESKFQDETYGPGKRLHNKASDKWRCTICEKEKTSAVKIEDLPKAA